MKPYDDMTHVLIEKAAVATADRVMKCLRKIQSELVEVAAS